ncbi:MAG: sporulation protein YabP [Halanaerobiaceae bacterium]
MSNEENKVFQGKQNLTLNDRKFLAISGVKEVISYNEDKVLLQTTQGIMDIKGNELNIQKLNLDEGNVKIEGLIISLIYTDKTKEKGILKKLFK